MDKVKTDIFFVFKTILLPIVHDMEMYKIVQ